MGIYNLKVYEYVGGYQLRLYSKGRCYNERASFPSIKPAGLDGLKPDILNAVHESESEKVHTSELFEPTPEQSEQSARVSRSRTVSQIYEISRANVWEYFLTLTFDRNKLDSSNYDLLCNKVSKWINNIRSRYASDLKYLIVPELHKDGIHYHFHGLLSHIGNMVLKDSGIIKNGHKIYNLENWKYGFSTVSKVLDTGRVSSYITKYVTKDLCTVAKSKRRYWCSRNCDRAKVRVYNLDYDDISNFFDKNVHLMQHVSDTLVRDTGLKITYVEMKKEDNIPDFLNINSQLNSLMELTSIRQKDSIHQHNLEFARFIRRRLDLDSQFVELTDFELEKIKEYFP